MMVQCPHMRRFFFSFLLLSFFGFGCSADTTPSTPSFTSPMNGGGSTNSETPATVPDVLYTSFIINVHDWSNPTQSIATLNHILDIHEKYQIPVDIYLDDPVVQMYAVQAKDLLERLRTSPLAAVSYHLRPPYPYYTDFDWKGLDALSTSDLTALLTNYETHAIDLTTGEPTTAPGGYQYLKDLMGYAPYTVAGVQAGAVDKLANDLYQSMGAQMTLVHGRETKLGQKEGGLWLRPETLEVKVYEKKNRYAGEDVWKDSVAKISSTGQRFINLKWHEDNFYTSGTPWGAVYYDGGDKTKPLTPPFDLSAANVPAISQPKTDAQQSEQWQRYEELVSYVASHKDEVTALNSPQILELMPE